MDLQKVLIRKAMLACGISSMDGLARALGVSRATVAAWSGGRTMPGPARILLRFMARGDIDVEPAMFDLEAS